MFDSAPDRPSRGPEPAASSVPWDLSHLRIGLASSAVLAVVGVPALWLWQGQRAGLAVLLGLAIVAAFFCIGSLAVAWAGRVNDKLTLPAALGSYVIKIGVLGVVLVTLPHDGPFDVRVLAFTVLVGTIVWAGLHARWVWSRPTFYVDYTPPSAAPEKSVSTGADEAAHVTGNTSVTRADTGGNHPGGG